VIGLFGVLIAIESTMMASRNAIKITHETHVDSLR
jgi:hypothetical protein